MSYQISEEVVLTMKFFAMQNCTFGNRSVRNTLINQIGIGPFVYNWKKLSDKFRAVKNQLHQQGLVPDAKEEEAVLCEVLDLFKAIVFCHGKLLFVYCLETSEEFRKFYMAGKPEALDQKISIKNKWRVAKEFASSDLGPRWRRHAKFDLTASIGKVNKLNM
jgi:hypothetical protein